MSEEKGAGLGSHHPEPKAVNLLPQQVLPSPLPFPRVLLAIVTCFRFRARAYAQRRTWVPGVSGADIRFFLGSPALPSEPDEIFVNAGDHYQALPFKVREVFKWALARGYDYVFKMDDDVYVQPDRLLASDFQHDYLGVPTGGPENDLSAVHYASGFLYCVSRRAMEIAIANPIKDWAEDRWVGSSLERAGIPLKRAEGYAIIKTEDPMATITGQEGPRAGNDVIAACEFSPEKMVEIHESWLSSNQREVRYG